MILRTDRGPGAWWGVSMISKAEFDAAYDELILGRVFVEYPDYYVMSRARFWQCFQRIDALPLREGARVVDVGGGIMAVLLHRLKGFQALVGDVNDTAGNEIRDLGIGYQIIDLFAGQIDTDEPFDLVVLQEVIEHIPVPPYIVLGKLKAIIKSGGYLVLTTPNGHRLRNVMYMLAGREILGLYKYPAPNEALGHQHEYTMWQMKWQADNSGLSLTSAEYYEDGFKGATAKARAARALLSPLTRIDRLKNGLMLVLQNA